MAEQGAAVKAFDPAVLQRITDTLNDAVDQGAVSGFVTLIWRSGEVVQLNTPGLCNVERGLPMQRDSLFRIASMTKPIVSLAALMLIEEGRLSLRDPISKWLPEFTEMRVLIDPVGPLDQTYPAPRQITVEDLMLHRAGLAYSFSAAGPLGRAYDAELGPSLASPLTPDQWLAKLAALPLIYPPGHHMHYSHATDVLGFLLGRLEGKTLGEVLWTRIFEPLGMKDTAFWLPPEKRDRLAHLYTRPPAGGPLKDVSLPMGDEPHPFEGGGGGLISSLDDYLTFARLMLGGGEVDGVRLVKPTTMALMLTDRLTPAQHQFSFLGLPYWEGMGFGLGVSVILDSEKHQVLGAGADGSFGWPGAFGTWWQADPENEMIMIYMVQDSVTLSAEVITGARAVVVSRTALSAFQKLTYEALKA